MANEFQIQLKIDRAKHHIGDLETRIHQFLATKPYKVAIKIDSQSRKPIYYVSAVDPVPDSLALVAGDVIHNLICALDHLAYQLIMKDTAGSPPDPFGIYFPIGETVEKYKTKKDRQISGAGKHTICAIDALKPYKGGNDLFWQLSRLNNVDKHRLLLAVGSQAAGVNLIQHMANFLPGDIFSPEDKASLSMTGLFFTPSDTGFPLKEGFELLIGGVDEKPNPNQQFLFDVALNEPGIIESKSILVSLREFAAIVSDAFLQLGPLLK
jgi:hypothetical protein